MPLDANQIAFAKDLLKAIRDEYKPMHPQGSLKAGICSVALMLIHLIESRAPESELWTSSPDAESVTPDSRLGDHLYITRRHFGLTA